MTAKAALTIYKPLPESFLISRAIKPPFLMICFLRTIIISSIIEFLPL